jgi:hypothetical protein
MTRPYQVARMVPKAYARLYNRIGRHAEPYNSLCGYDGAELIGKDGSRMRCPATDVELAASFGFRGNGKRVIARFNGRYAHIPDTIETWRPYWLPLDSPDATD